MGVILAGMRKQFLLACKYDLEFKISKISESIASLATEQTNLMASAANIADSESVVYKKIKAKEAKLNELEKQLMMKKDKFEKKLRLIEEEIKSADQMFEKGADKAMSYYGQGGGR